MWSVLTEPGMKWLWMWFVLRGPCSVDVTCKSKNCQTPVVHHRTERHADRLTNKYIRADRLTNKYIRADRLTNKYIRADWLTEGGYWRLYCYCVKKLCNSTDAESPKYCCTPHSPLHSFPAAPLFYRHPSVQNTVLPNKVLWSALFLLPGSSYLELTPCFCPPFYLCQLF